MYLGSTLLELSKARMETFIVDGYTLLWSLAARVRCLFSFICIAMPFYRVSCNSQCVRHHASTCVVLYSEALNSLHVFGLLSRTCLLL